ncbi:MAG: hypothetical protein V4724_26430 [Pseudomonadota bacterium]
MLENMQGRQRTQLSEIVDQALKKLTPTDHIDALVHMTRSGVPTSVITRILFGQNEVRGRRQDHDTAEALQRALAILRISGEEDAAAYLQIHALPDRIAERVLHGGEQDRRRYR